MGADGIQPARRRRDIEKRATLCSTASSGLLLDEGHAGVSYRALSREGRCHS